MSTPVSQAMPRTSRAPARPGSGGGVGPRLVLLLLLLALLVALVFGLLGSLRGPVTTSAELRHRRSPEREALAQRAFLNAQVALARSDSINIVLDARENRLWIVMKGVRLRECRISPPGLDSSIKSLVTSGNEAIWTDRPFTLIEKRGNLPDPWQPVQQGPVDTVTVGGIKAMKERPMEGSLVFDRGLVLHLEPPPTKADSLALQGSKGFQKRLEKRKAEMTAALDEMTKGPTTFDIYLYISREDAAAALRALSVGGLMALHL